MKNIIPILGTITLIGTSTTSLVACNTPQEYTTEELAKEKEKNKITTKDGILEWIAPQEKPFNTVDNKWYYVVWRGDKNDNWRIVKFKHDNSQIWHNKNISDYNSNKLILHYYGLSNLTDLVASKKAWTLDNDNTYIKSVYRWNLDTPEPNLILNENGNVKVNKCKLYYEV